MVESVWDSRTTEPMFHLGAEQLVDRPRSPQMTRYDMRLARDVEHILGSAAICHSTIVSMIPDDDIRPILDSQRCGVVFRSYDILLRASSLYRRLVSPHGQAVKPSEVYAAKRESNDLLEWVEVIGKGIRVCVIGKCNCPDRKALGIA